MNLSGRHVRRARIKEWVTVYEDKDGHRIRIRAFSKPTKHRTFRVSVPPGRRKFKAVSVKYKDKELVYVAKTKKGTKKGKKEELDEEELEELEDLEDLDDLEEDEADEEDEDAVEEDDDDEDEDEDEDDDDSDDEDEDESDEDDDEEDDEEEEAPPKKSKKSKSKKTKKGSSRAKGNGKVGTQEVAAAAGCDARTLRMVLRKHSDKFDKDEETGRYEWSSLKHPDVKALIKLIKERGEGKKVKKESLDNLKKGKSKSKAKSKSKSKKKKSTDDE